MFGGAGPAFMGGSGGCGGMMGSPGQPGQATAACPMHPSSPLRCPALPTLHPPPPCRCAPFCTTATMVGGGAGARAGRLLCPSSSSVASRRRRSTPNLALSSPLPARARFPEPPTVPALHHRRHAGGVRRSAGGGLPAARVALLLVGSAEAEAERARGREERGEGEWTCAPLLVPAPHCCCSGWCGMPQPAAPATPPQLPPPGAPVRAAPG